MKVAAYCRVSTDKEDQANSFENQQRYFREYINHQPDWELYEIYADEGITGTNTKKRAAFNRMIDDARQHRFDLIVTKEISRFARNTLDSLAYTRELKRMGIGVFFLNDSINTLNEDSEMLLTIKSTLAQEESRSTSTRVKWGQTRRMEQGVVFGRSLLGYDVQNGKITVNQQGAEIVRMIFHKYVYERKGTTVIARELQEAGCKTLTGSTNWRNTVILKILRNEKYCGDLKQKKTITPDYLTHQKKYNRGEEKFIFLRDHHEPIIEREVWNEAQREISRRNIDGKYSTGHGNRYPLSGKIKCGKCGQSFVSRTRRRKDGIRYRTWRCSTAASEGRCHVNSSGSLSGCDVSYQLRDEVGIEMVQKSVNMLKLDTDSVIRSITRIVLESILLSRNGSQLRIKQLKKERNQIEAKKKSTLDAFFSNHISREDMQLMNVEYEQHIAALTNAITAAESQEHLPCETAELEKDIQAKVTGIVSGANTSGALCGNLLDHMTAYPDRRIEVYLKQFPAKWIFILKSPAVPAVSSHLKN